MTGRPQAAPGSAPVPYAPNMPSPKLLTVAQVAAQLGVTEKTALQRIRTTAVPGTVRRNDGVILFPADQLQQLASRRRGPSRPVTLTPGKRAQLVRRAQAALAKQDRAREAMSAAAAERQAAILELADGGLSVRDIAADLGVAPASVQAALTEARRRG